MECSLAQDAPNISKFKPELDLPLFTTEET